MDVAPIQDTRSPNDDRRSEDARRDQVRKDNRPGAFAAWLKSKVVDGGRTPARLTLSPAPPRTDAKGATA